MTDQAVGQVRLSARALTALRWVGRAAFSLQILFALMAKGGSGLEVGVWYASGAICIAGVLVYASVGRLILPGTSRAELRPAFRPYILGTALLAGTVALWAAFFLSI